MTESRQPTLLNSQAKLPPTTDSIVGNKRPLKHKDVLYSYYGGRLKQGKSIFIVKPSRWQ